MNRQGIRSIVILGIPVIVAFFGCSLVSAQGTTTRSSIEAFLAAPSISTWQTFEADVHSKRYDPGTPYRDVIDYHDARSKRDLPNSMARTGITPDKYVTLQSKRADSALGRIQKKASEDLWRLLRALAVQVFDEDLLCTACEIAARVSPVRFEEFAADVVRLHPEQSWIIERIRERWLPVNKPKSM
jgi:hypothetical protein